VSEHREGGGVKFTVRLCYVGRAADKWVPGKSFCFGKSPALLRCRKLIC
jgi:hypothetical protein